MEEKFVNNREVNIHTLKQIGSEAVTLLMIPGMFGVAEHWADEFKHLKEYSLVAMSVRGRGKSTAPENGYTFQDHVSDVVAVGKSLNSKNLILCAHSYGCQLAVASAVELENVKGLILVDKGMRANKISDKWLTFVQENPPPTSSVAVARKIHAASQAEDLMEDLKRLRLPTLFFKGELEGSHLDEAEVSELLEIPGVQVVRLKNSAHSPSSQDYELFVDHIRQFLRSIRT